MKTIENKKMETLVNRIIDRFGPEALGIRFAYDLGESAQPKIYTFSEGGGKPYSPIFVSMGGDWGFSLGETIEEAINSLQVIDNAPNSCTFYRVRKHMVVAIDGEYPGRRCSMRDEKLFMIDDAYEFDHEVTPVICWNKGGFPISQL